MLGSDGPLALTANGDDVLQTVDFKLGVPTQQAMFPTSTLLWARGRAVVVALKLERLLALTVGEELRGPSGALGLQRSP